MKNYLILITACACLTGCATAGSDLQNGAAPSGVDLAAGPPVFQKPIDLIPSALGSLVWKISTKSEQAQAYFNQGLQLRYAYGVDDAARSFREARLADPECAMCFWG